VSTISIRYDKEKNYNKLNCKIMLHTLVNVYIHADVTQHIAAKSYQPVLGSARSKLLFCTLLRLISRYIKIILRVFAYFLLTSDLKWPGVTDGRNGHR